MGNHPLETFVVPAQRIIAAPLFRLSCTLPQLKLTPTTRIVSEGRDDWHYLKPVVAETFERSFRDNLPTHSIESDWTEYCAGRELLDKALEETGQVAAGRDDRQGALDLWVRWRDELRIEERSRKSLLLAARAVRSTLGCLRLLGSNGVAVPGFVFYERSWKNSESTDALGDVSIFAKEYDGGWAGLAATPELDTATREPLTLEGDGTDELLRLSKLTAERDSREWNDVCDRWNELHALAHRPTELCFKAVALLERLNPTMRGRSLADDLAAQGEALMPNMERERIYRSIRTLVTLRNAMAHGKPAPDPQARVAPQLAEFAMKMCRASLLSWLQPSNASGDLDA